MARSPFLHYPICSSSSRRLNGDGKADLAITNHDKGVKIVPGNGDGTFQTAVLYPTSLQSGVGADRVFVGDFNGDDKADLVTASDDVSGVSVLLGNGDGSFQPPLNVATLAPPDALVPADFNGDGRADLAIGYGSPNSAKPIAIFLGNGDGTFQTPVTYLPGSGYASLEAGDFDGDGNLDLAVGTANGVLSILPGNGDGTFRAPISSMVGRPFNLIAAEFNGDGKTDLMAGGEVLLGTTLTLLTGGTPQSTDVGTAFPTQLQATLRDGTTPVSGATVTFFVPSSGASAILSSSTAVTNASGLASVGATANSIAGNYTVLASSLNLLAYFSLSNTAGSLTATGGTPQSAGVGTSFDNPLQVTLRDSGGNPVGGVTVTFTVPASGPSAILSSSTAVTNASGLASVTATANSTAGVYFLSATAAGVSAQFSLTNTRATPVNLALGRVATQSSTLAGYVTAVASSAVDGNTDGGFFNGSVTHTNSEANAWWQVDLGASATISAVVIWNRTDACCVSRLGDYWVFISDVPFGTSDTPATLQNRAYTFSRHQTSAPSPSATITFPGTGRHLRVQINGTGVLSLAEVQTFGTYIYEPLPAVSNLAVGKVASQSSTYIGSPTTVAGAAVDGNTDGNFFNSSVTHTNAEANAWWQVDLGSSASVNSIRIYNRTDCCSDRLSDYWIFVSDTPFNASDTPATLQNRANTFSSHQTGAPNPSSNIATSAAQGQYVRIQLSGTNNLSLAEVQVFGIFYTPPAVNLALK